VAVVLVEAGCWSAGSLEAHTERGGVLVEVVGEEELGVGLGLVGRKDGRTGCRWKKKKTTIL
jgi:hypothetical protein